MTIRDNKDHSLERLLQEKLGKSARIMAFTYYNAGDGNLNLRVKAVRLLEAVTACREDLLRPLVFIACGLGGVVVKHVCYIRTLLATRADVVYMIGFETGEPQSEIFYAGDENCWSGMISSDQSVYSAQ